MVKIKKSAAKNKNTNKVAKALDKVGKSRRAVVLITLVGLLAFGGIGAYVVNRSNAATDYAGLCGRGYTLTKTIKFTEYNQTRVYTKETGVDTDWCAFTVRIGDARGVYGYTRAFIMSDMQNMNNDEDKGQYKYYAGPVKVLNVKAVVVASQVNYDGQGTVHSLKMSR